MIDRPGTAAREHRPARGGPPRGAALPAAGPEHTPDRPGQQSVGPAVCGSRRVIPSLAVRAWIRGRAVQGRMRLHSRPTVVGSPFAF